MAQDRARHARRAFRGGAASGRRLLWIILGLGSLAIISAVLLASMLPPRRLASEAAAPGSVGTRVGDTAPDFRLVDIEKASVTRSSLVAGKPGLIFFTATWCFPCVEGLTQLMRYQQDIGGARFNVLVVFVDPGETEADIRAYRERFAFPRAWHYALDRDNLVRKYSIRYLDTKFVLDRSGVIRYTDFYPAGYSTWVRALATVGIPR